MEQTYKFYVSGMHCRACVMLIDDRLKEYPGVTSARADLARREIIITGNLIGDQEKVIQDLNLILKSDGYTLSTNKTKKTIVWSEFYYALPMATTLIAVFIWLQKLGLVNLVSGNNVSYSTALVIGLIASVSTCLAIVGGLVLSLSASYAKSGAKARTQIMFHLGRLLTFFVLGGVIGTIGSALHLNWTVNLIISMVVGLVMLVLGFNLLDLTDFTQKFQIVMPKHIAKKVLAPREVFNFFTPFLVGGLTFFMPCGFTQSMQIYALSTGSFFKGALTMLIFVLGTLPMLSLLSFSSFSIISKPWQGIFFKTAGLIVMAMAIFNLLNLLAVAGIINPIFNL
ncbi:MAG: hypothetical protein C3F02_02880 [Parcubacteria group bacterium]|nr:MAG: hypothetical protein C3F02_02880 [Parcubacteria group bacterium]